MNKIYKTIRHALTGQTVAASEYAKSAGSSQQTHQSCPAHASTELHPMGSGCHAASLGLSVSMLALAMLSNHATAQQLTYDGTSSPGTTTLEQASAIGTGGLPAWVRVGTTDEGLIYRDGGNSVVLTGADLVINDAAGTAPAFVIGGYSDLGGPVEQNTVTLTQGAVNGPVYGGLSHRTRIQETVFGTPGGADTSANASADISGSSVRANENKIVVEGSAASVTGNLYGGHATVWAQAGQATAGGNASSTSSTKATAEAYADAYAYGSTLTASDNTVTLGQDTSVLGDVYGGYAQLSAQVAQATAGDASNTGGASANAIAQTSTYTASSTLTASGNTVTLAQGASMTGNIYGGYAQLSAQAGEANAGNAITNATTTANAYADANTSADTYDATLTASGNTVTLAQGASITGNVYGGYAQLSAQVAQATAGDASNAGGAYATANATVIAHANSSTLIASGNTITLAQGASISEHVYGGYAQLSAQAGEATSGDATNATTTANTNTTATASANATSSTLTASDNTVTLGQGASVFGDMYGGYAQLSAQVAQTTAGDASNAGGAHVYADAHADVQAQNAIVSANDNRASVAENTAVGGNIYGGYAALSLQGGSATGGFTNAELGHATATINVSDTQVLANDNHVRFNGTLQNGASIYGGYVKFDITLGTATKADTSLGYHDANFSGSEAIATGNTVSIGESAQFISNTGSLYGGYLQANVNLVPNFYDTFTGNTLEWSAKAPARFQTVGNFEHYKFTINPAYANTSTALITANDITLGTNDSNMEAVNGTAAPSKLSVVGIHSGNVLNAGDGFILMQATNSMTGDGQGATSTGIAQQGISLLYDVKTDVNMADQRVTATILNCQTSAGGVCPTGGGNGGGNAARVNPQLKALSEGYLAGAMLVTRGADVIADDAFSAIDIQNNQNGWVPFAVMAAQHNHYNSGSHITSNDFLLTGGLSYQQDNLTAGAFLEGGWGNYDSYNSFYNAANVHGDGNTRYFGAGLLGRYALDSGLYTDASIRFGQTRTKFDTTDIQNFATGQYASYNLTSSYMSAHVGVGYLLPLGEKNELDLSAKYLYSIVGGKDVLVAGDPIHFDRVNSHRARVNATLNHRYSENLTLNAGLGYEHEFDGKARATTYSTYNIDAPSVRGGTGLVSIGANIKPSSNQRLSLDIKANGYTGKREGVGASIRLNYAF